MKTTLFLLLASSSFELISASLPSVRFRQGCVVLQQKIYCYGGGQYVSGAVNYNSVLNDHLTLDLSQDFALKDAQSAWIKLPDPSNFVLEPNYAFAYTPISNTSYLITSGAGYNDGHTYLKNKTIVYHSDTNRWESINTAANQSIGATVNIDQNGDARVFGGVIAYTNVSPNLNFMNLNINSEQWVGAVLGTGTTFRADHASDIDNQGIIYYVGGRMASPSGSTYTWGSNVPMTSITTYDTAKQTWGSISIVGTSPSPRNQHTFTYMPKVNQFVLFGGKPSPSSETPGSINDICYTFDPTTKSWTIHSVGQIGSGSRFGHSAVLYMDQYLFIIFGADQITMSLNDFHLLDVQSWIWLDNFSASGNTNETNGTSNGNGGGNNTANTTKDSLNGGAIAGIVIGIIAFLGIAGAGLFFLGRRNRKATSTSVPRSSPSSNHEAKPQDDFVIDQEYHDSPEQKYFSPTAQNFMQSGGSVTNLTQAVTPTPIYNQQNYQREERSYHPDEMSTSTAPTYTSMSPLVTSPTSTFVNSVSTYPSQGLQPKPDLTMNDNTDPNTVKPYAPH
ncbi:uncharacterized protein BX664DRAFT_328715 [Halteromyces radiatus]|uniref:uncharacterized protein n=1 Tax=Halteromyces radiatus TaxID=101107 RepID=UPI00221FA59B|nr:uncharacterized protein BX664DRAFT_328715 [Halteromyces radiatus]KAI8093009.1 hypothetical protein BX664DRAFT_328715 [Halteromyces radiatus]